MQVDLSLIPFLKERSDALKAHEVWIAAFDDLEGAREKAEGVVSDEEFANLEDAEAVAKEICNDCSALMEDGDGEPAFCALSGVPLLEDDDVLSNPKSDRAEIVLRCLVLPPRKEEDKQMLKEMEEA